MSDFNFRADLEVSPDNTPDDALRWLEKRYKQHSGSKRDFVRSLVFELYRKELKEEKEDDINLRELKREIRKELVKEIPGLIKEIVSEDVGEKIKNNLKQLEKREINEQDMILGQLE